MTVTLLDKQVGDIGYGMMGLSWRQSPPSLEQALETLKAALNNGCNYWNGGEIYGTPEYNSLHILKHYFTKYPKDADKVVICIKGSYNTATQQIDTSPEGIRRSVENCYGMLKGIKKIDLFECARVGKDVPIETSMKALEELVQEGKIGGISLSEVGEELIRRAAKVTKISAVEVEVSLFSTDIWQNGVAKACAELDIPVVAYSPISRGFLTGQIKTIEDVPPELKGMGFPRFLPGNFEKNLQLVEDVLKMAKKKDVTPPQLAINWVRAQSKRNGNPDIIPIPGSTTVARVEENSKVVDFTEEELAEIDAMLKKLDVVGERYPEAMTAHWDH